MIELVGQLARVGLTEPLQTDSFSDVVFIDGRVDHLALIDSAGSRFGSSRFSAPGSLHWWSRGYPPFGSSRGGACVESHAAVPWSRWFW